MTSFSDVSAFALLFLGLVWVTLLCCVMFEGCQNIDCQVADVTMDPPVPCSPTCEVASLTEGAPRILLMGQTGYCICCCTVC